MSGELEQIQREFGNKYAYQLLLKAFRERPEQLLPYESLNISGRIRDAINGVRKYLGERERISGVLQCGGYVYTKGRDTGAVFELSGTRPDPPWFEKSGYARELQKTGKLMRSVRLKPGNIATPMATTQQYNLFVYLAPSIEGALISYDQLIRIQDIDMYEGNMDMTLNRFQHVLASSPQCPLDLDRRHGYGVRLVRKSE